MAEAFSLKNYIDRKAVRRLGKQIRTAFPKFPLDRFVKDSCKGLASLEFTQRTAHVARAVRDGLPDDTRRALKIITDCLPEPLPASEGMFSDNFWLWPLGDFIRDFGAEHWAEATRACHVLTQCHTAEFAIRPHLQTQPDKTLKLLLNWTKDKSEHVRRLCSEGTRPRLPWASRLELPRKQVLAILESLKADPSKFVQKSVANHLNDIGKDDPDWLIRTMKTWNKQANDSTQWIIRHALRTQIKDGDARALAVIGFKPAKFTRAQLTITPKKVAIGKKIDATMRLECKRAKRLLIDWVMHYARPNREPYRKVFKGKEVTTSSDEPFVWKKSFDMTPRNTRSLHPGKHRLEVQVNGSVVAAAEFQLKPKL